MIEKTAALRRRAAPATLVLGVILAGGIGYAAAETTGGSASTPGQYPIPAGFPSAKASALGTLNQQIVAAAPSAADKSAMTATTDESPQTAAPLAAGINNELHAGPFPVSTLQVSNVWQGNVGSSWDVVYVGASDGSPAIRVYTKSRDASQPADLTYIGTYQPTDADAGSTYQVVRVSGDSMQFSSGSSFDLGSLSYDD